MSNMITNQKQDAASLVEMDAGKFLRMINTGARSQLVLFEERIRKMGQEMDANWRLVTVDHKSLVFEDIDQNQYYIANIERLKHGKIKIGNIKGIKVVESKKEESFHKNVKDLVEHICEEDMKSADMVFNRISAQRFRSTVIPESNLVTTRDGIVRMVPVARTIVPNNLKPQIIKAVCEALSDRIKVSRGRIVEATFGNTSFEFPVSELVRRRVVARSMKEVAQDAYMSEGFQNRVKHVAGMVCKDDIQEAVQIAAKLLSEDQEFSLLNLSEMRELVGNALATQGIMNENLANDVGLLFFRTNCKINKNVILKEWKETARMTEYAPLVENVRRLEDSKDFESDYQNFLHVVFNEDMTTKQAKAKMYLAALREMKNVLSGSPNAELVEAINEYIQRLENAGDEVDDATLMEVEAMVASTSENLLKNVEDLSNFRDIPGEKEEELAPQFGDVDLSDEAGVSIRGGGPRLPLELGGEEEGLPPEEGLEEAGEEEPGEELPEEFPEELPEELLAADVQRKGAPISEKVGINDIPQKQLQEAVSKLSEEQLKLELDTWKKNSEQYFAEDGLDRCTVQLNTYIDHAKKINSNLAENFKEILVSNTPIEASEESAQSADPYEYQAPEGVEINKGYGFSEDHETWKAKMKQTKEGGQVGGKESAKGDAMGCQGDKPGESTMKGGPATLKKGAKTATEGMVRCEECHGSHDMAECMTQEGAICPECGAPMADQLLEALSDEGHEMDRVSDGKGIAGVALAKDKGTGNGGEKQKMDHQGGKGVAGRSAQKSDGQSAGGSKDKIEQDGKSIAGGVEGEVEEDQYKDPTRRRRLASVGKGRSSLVKTEGKTVVMVTDEPMDKVVSNIAANMTEPEDEIEPEEEGMEGLAGEMPPDEDEFGTIEGEVGEEGEGEGLDALTGPGEEDIPGEEGEEMPPVGGEGEEFPPSEEEVPVPETGEEVEGEEVEGEEEEGEEEEGEEEEEMEEGKLPAHLKKYQFKKSTGADKGDEGDEKAEPSKKPWEKKEVTEDNDVTTPTSKKYANDKPARSDGDGKMMKPKPKFKETDVAGKKNANPARSGGE